jgi:dihydrodipicolinate synthase/N-acetylneuraminate lyase
MNKFSALDRRQFLGGLSATAVVAATASMPRFVEAAASQRKLAGVFPIGFTPIINDKVDFDGMASQMKFCRKSGVHGIAWPQLASGWSTLSEAERLGGAEALCDAAKGGPSAVIIGVQSKTADLEESGRYAKQAERLGADGLICIPPPGMNSAAELLAYYQKVGALSSLPLMAQAVGDFFTVDLLVEMYEKIPTLRYVKDESGEPLERITEIRKRTDDKLKSFSGRGVSTMITEMERGFSGHCPYVSLADVYSTAYDQFHAGNKRAAYDTFGKILASNAMMSQNDVNILIARGVFKEGTTTRVSPPVPGAPPPRRVRVTVEEARRVLDTYLKRDLRA